MFALSKGIINQMTKKDEYSISILGLDNAGKTTFLEKAKSIFNETPMVNPAKITATVGMNIGKIDHRRIRLNFWDVGGQLELQTLWERYIAECHAIIFVVDAANEKRLAESEEAFRKVIAFERVSQLPLLILFNKCDDDDDDDNDNDNTSNDGESSEKCLSDRRNALQKFQQELIQGSKRNDDINGEVDGATAAEMAIISVSALKGDNVERAVRWVADAIMRQYSFQS